MKKRSSKDEADESSSETEMMKVDEPGGDSSDENGELGPSGREEAVDTRQSSTSNDRSEEMQPFLDTFYGLSSSDPRERAISGQALLYHTLTGPDANIKDASYALKRLFNGLCSGRAAARQGNASTLTTFLKLAQSKRQSEISVMDSIQQEFKNEDDTKLSNIAIVRQQLLKATDIRSDETGRRKGAEDRDAKFGRLFGILAVIRSGSLLPNFDGNNQVDDIIEVASAYIDDVVELYRYKRWMREPAAHAICIILNSFYSICDKNPKACKIVDNLVHKRVIPELLEVGDGAVDSSSAKNVLSYYSAEQLAIGLVVQSHAASDKPISLGAPLKRPIVSRETMNTISAALCETSSVSLPRTHLVWDALWLYLTCPLSENSKPTGTRIARVNLSIGIDTVADILESLAHEVILPGLLALSDTHPTKRDPKLSHDRRALAMCLLRNALGLEFNSSMTGRTRLHFDSEFLETVVLTPNLIMRMFVDVICNGASGHRDRGDHLLKPFALRSLEAIAASVSFEDISDDLEYERRLAFARAFARCDPRFDGLTKASMIASLLDLSKSTFSQRHISLWKNFIEFAEDQIFHADSSHVAIGFVDLIFNVGKHALRLPVVNEQSLSNGKKDLVLRILTFMLTVGFFDFRKFVVAKKPSEQKSYIDAALRVRTKSSIPYDLRCVLSSRLFSLLADCVTFSSNFGAELKQFAVLDVVAHLADACSHLTALGSTYFGHGDDDDIGDSDGDVSHNDIARGLNESALAARQDLLSGSDPSLARFTASSALLAGILNLLLLRLPAENSSGDFAERDSLVAMISDVKDMTLLLKDGESESCSSLAAVCVNVLSIHVDTGDNAHGASAKLLRDVVKLTWSSGLSLLAFKGEKDFGTEALSILLAAIGAVADDENSPEEESDDDAEVSASFETSSRDSSDAPAELPETQNGEDDSVEESDIKLDSEQLQALLEDDSDAELDGGRLSSSNVALTKFLEARNESRKSGQTMRDRKVVHERLRCVMLLETLLQGRTDGWGKLLRADHILGIIAPVLDSIGELEKSTKKAVSDDIEPLMAEKRALHDRLSSFVQTKLFKVKIDKVRWSNPDPAVEVVSKIGEDIIAKAKMSSSASHQFLCSCALVFTLRALSNPHERLDAACKLYGDALNDWAMNRPCKLESSFFHTLFDHGRPCAQAGMIEAVAEAAASARSAYLKAEAFRLMSKLFTRSRDDGVEATEAIRRMSSHTGTIFSAVASELGDPDMVKAKRGKEVLRALQAVLEFYGPTPVLTEVQVEALMTALRTFKDQCESEAANSSCDKLLFRLSEVTVLPKSGASTHRQERKQKKKKGKKRKN